MDFLSKIKRKSKLEQLRTALYNRKCSQGKIIEMIKSNGNINQLVNYGGSTVLHYAIRSEMSEVAEFLFENGVNINCQNDDGKTPLFEACEAGLIDEIWMLLFYGADPNIPVFLGEYYYACCTHEGVGVKTSRNSSQFNKILGKITCFDLAALHTNKAVQKLFIDDLKDHKKHFSLRTFMKALAGRGVPFEKLMKEASDINHTEDDSRNFFFGIKNNPVVFTEFLSKFPHVIEDVIKNYDTMILDCGHQYSFPAFVIIMLTLFDSNVADVLVDQIHSKNSLFINYIIDSFKNRRDFLDMFMQLICSMLSHGVTLNSLAIHQIYFAFGHCELLEVLLHMDLSRSCDIDRYCNNYDCSQEPSTFNNFLQSSLNYLKSFMNPLFPQVLYDMQTELSSMIQLLIPFLSEEYDAGITKDTICMVFAHFAFPKSLKCQIFELSACKATFKEDEYQKFMDSQSFPEQPTLIERSRLRAREFIIKKYNVKNSMQFYTVLKQLPIPPGYKEILSFKRKLYPLNK